MSLTLRKIIKIVDTRWRILRLKCTKFDFGWGSAQDPAGGAYSALPDPLAGFAGRFAAGGEGEGEGKGREGKRKGGKGGPPSYCWTRAPQSLATPLLSTAVPSQHLRGSCPPDVEWSPEVVAKSKSGKVLILKLN